MGTASKKKKKPQLRQLRHYARQRAIQALYQRHFQAIEADSLIRQFLSGQTVERVSKDDIDQDYFKVLVEGVITKQVAIDQAIIPLLDRPIEQLSPIELAVLRLGAYELLYQPTVPYKVAINEALELAKAFGSDKGYQYVNGVLDRLAKSVNTIK